MGDTDLHVTGGAGGVTARYDDLETLAQLSDDLALILGRVSLECHEALVDPDLLASGILDPAGAARFEEHLVVALDGPTGLTMLALGFGEQAVGLRAVVFSYQAADEAGARALDALRWTAGFVAGPVLVLSSPLLLALYEEYRLADGSIDWERLLTDHPGIVDELIGSSPGLITGLTPFNVADVQGAAALLGELYPDGVPVGTTVGVDSSHDGHPPSGFGDLMETLSYRDGQSPPGSPDEIDVRVITHPGGTRSYIVDIPGTKEWDTPGASSALNDLGTNVHAMAGQTTALEEAIADALHRAGASSTDPVMLVGHSQGGLVAAQAAHDTTTGAFGYNVTHVVTAGAPIGRIDVPANVQVLALENSHDIVPHLDAAENPDRANVTTVTFDAQHGNIDDNHALGATYVPAATALDGSTDASVTAFRDSAGAFLSTPDGGATVQTTVYQYTRG
jgi:pimeloyl-ACP methyl ester carboxylesterase